MLMARRACRKAHKYGAIAHGPEEFGYRQG